MDLAVSCLISWPSETWGAVNWYFKPLSFGIICHIAINDQNRGPLFMWKMSSRGVQWTWCLVCGAQWVWDPISWGSHIWRVLKQGLGQMVGFPASGEIFHFSVTDDAVSPIPGFIQAVQFRARVLKPWPSQRCDSTASKISHLDSHYIPQRFSSHSLPA